MRWSHKASSAETYSPLWPFHLLAYAESAEALLCRRATSFQVDVTWGLNSETEWQSIIQTLPSHSSRCLAELMDSLCERCCFRLEFPFRSPPGSIAVEGPLRYWSMRSISGRHTSASSRPAAPSRCCVEKTNELCVICDMSSNPARQERAIFRGNRILFKILYNNQMQKRYI